MDTWGTAYGSSRDANITLSIYKEAENYLKDFLQQEDVVTVSSGTLAGFLTQSVLTNRSSQCFYLPKTHPSVLLPNSQPIFVADEINPLVFESSDNEIIIVCDAIPSLETGPSSFDFLDEILSEKNILLVVDESHSFGVLGTHGNGIAGDIQKRNNLDIIVVGSLGKAFGLTGGVIAGSTGFINSIKELSLFKGAAGMSPASLTCFMRAGDFYERQRKKLKNNIAYVISKLKKQSSIKIAATYPVIFHSDDTLFDYLYKKNIIITSFFYPTTGKKLNRIVLSAAHNHKQLDTLIECLNAYNINQE